MVPVLFLGAACGTESGTTSGSSSSPDTGAATTSESATADDAIENVEVSGEVGQEPKVSIDTPLQLDETRSQVVVTGEGEPVREGEQALLHVYVANGTTGEKAASTYDQGAPATVPMNPGQFFPAVLDALVGTPSGSRVVVAATPEDAYGKQGLKQLGLSGKDDVVFVVDVMSVTPADVLDGPQGEPADVPADLPTVHEAKNGDVSDLTFEDAPAKPSDKLQVITLVEGDGPPARDDSMVTVDYYGEVYGGDKAFDESYSREPVTFALGTGGLIKAWDEGLVGVNKGSRVMLIVPPDYGYGEQGSPQAGIKGGDTLVFVVDMLGVS